jgi:hypothetical protein
MMFCVVMNVITGPDLPCQPPPHSTGASPSTASPPRPPRSPPRCPLSDSACSRALGGAATPPCESFSRRDKRLHSSSSSDSNTHPTTEQCEPWSVPAVGRACVQYPMVPQQQIASRCQPLARLAPIPPGAALAKDLSAPRAVRIAVLDRVKWTSILHHKPLRQKICTVSSPR